MNTGVICHEMSHSLGTYDLYHVNDDLNPVGVWDLMSDNLLVPQQMSAYTKYRYCGWIDEIPEISEPGTYVLNPVGGEKKENVAYKIRPIGSEEYFVVEYRRKEGSTFDSGLPESGLLVYRINPAYTGGNVNYNGTTRLDEVYVFRAGRYDNCRREHRKSGFQRGERAYGFWRRRGSEAFLQRRYGGALCPDAYLIVWRNPFVQSGEPGDIRSNCPKRP